MFLRWKLVSWKSPSICSTRFDIDWQQLIWFSRNTLNSSMVSSPIWYDNYFHNLLNKNLFLNVNFDILHILKIFCRGSGKYFFAEKLWQYISLLFTSIWTKFRSEFEMVSLPWYKNFWNQFRLIVTTFHGHDFFWLATSINWISFNFPMFIIDTYLNFTNILYYFDIFHNLSWESRSISTTRFDIDHNYFHNYHNGSFNTINEFIS